MTYCRHCRRDRSLDEHIPLHMLLLMFLVLALVLLWGDAVRRASVRDCGDGPPPAARTSWPPMSRTIAPANTHGVDHVPLHATHGAPKPRLRP